MESSLYNCPHCNTPVGVELSDRFFYSCNACDKTYIQKSKERVPSTEGFSSDCDVLSPILLNSKGSYQSDNFKITGSIILYKINGLVVIHCALLSNGMYRYIIEEGSVFSYISTTTEKLSESLQKSAVGKLITISENEKIFCNSIETITSISLTGSGQFPAPNLSRAIWCSFLTNNSKAVFLIANKTGSVLLEGETIALNQLQVNPIRSFNDWCN